MVKLLLSTLGFEEVFPIRFIMRNSPSQGDIILIVMPYVRDERSARAYFELSKFVSNYLQGIILDKVEVPVANVHSSIAIIASRLSSLDVDYAVVNLSGGMRLLIIETLIASRMVLNNHTLKFEVELEDKKEVVTFTSFLLDIKMPNEQQREILKIIKELGAESSITKVAERLKLPRSSVYKELRRMEEKGLVARDKANRFTLTSWGFSWI